VQLDRWIAGVIAVALIPAWARGAEDSTSAEIEAAVTYALKCASCHGERRYGGYAPLSPAEARALVEFFRQPEAEVRWSLADVEASRIVEDPKGNAISAAVKREELILVVERGSGSISVLDGSSLRELDRFAVGRVHGGIKSRLATELSSTTTSTAARFARA